MVTSYMKKNHHSAVVNYYVALLDFNKPIYYRNSSEAARKRELCMLLNGSEQDTFKSDLKGKHQNNVFKFESRRITLYGQGLFETLIC